MHCFALLIIDLISIAVSSAFAGVLCDNLQVSWELLFPVFPYFLLTMLTAVPVFLAAGLNRTLWRFTSLNDCLRITLAVLVTVLAAVAAGFSLNHMDGVARSLPIMQGLLMTCALAGTRVAMRVRHAIRYRKRTLGVPFIAARESVLVIGLNSAAEFFLRSAAQNGADRIAVAGVLSTADRHRGRLLRSCPILGRPEELEKVIHEFEVHGVHVDRIIVATKFESLSPAAREALLSAKKLLNIRVAMLDHTFGFNEELLASPKTCDGPLTSAELDFEQLASRPYLRWKRVLDSAAAIFCIVFLAPLMVFVGLIVLFDAGYPPIFWQQRPGALGKPIKVLKFRTMGSARDQQGRHLTDAERISVVGRFLRRVRLDELPQVYNVLFGQTSLVGPRPLLPADQSPGASARLGLRPGLTGWAQINGGRYLSIHDKAALDLWYVKNASFGLDVAILLSTARTILFGERIDRHAIREAWRELGCEPPGTLGTQETSQTLG
jgi:lipopolysaccharide/colanic/teichoic acid biosynthesis glycosyltransferase